ncbi:GH25 family lysozyme [Hyphomicrobium sp.]|uniref:glycoside hydrolase family 25 protein n=1 Tax=Hyphomicrobium sp. TaxID=82 RepID=UPI002E30E4F1|nr:GH25 family lysozyme [Hyphomicrobium sp.]HEX2840941.1 GH25 family lysozyme [Hyphomicrobium sp.]
MSSRIRCAIIVIALAAVAVFAAPHVYPRFELAPLLYPVVGVDVSNHQGEIDWNALASSGVAFAYIKATEGGTFKDKSFARNWREAERVGVKRGAYHFFTLCKSAIEQAQNFIETVPKEPHALPPVVDAEHMGPCTATLTPSDHVAMLGQFLDTVEKHYGRRPIVYTTWEFDGAMLDNALPRERFWARSLVVPPPFRRDQWLIWQYHNRGRRPGVKGDLDLNVFCGSLDEFERFAAGITSPETIP